MSRVEFHPSMVTLVIVFFSLIGAGLCAVTGRGDPQNFLLIAGSSSGGYYGWVRNQGDPAADADEHHL
jgi:hypothetical protein